MKYDNYGTWPAFNTAQNYSNLSGIIVDSCLNSHIEEKSLEEDTYKLHDTLDSRIWKDNKLKPEVKSALINIANLFKDSLIDFLQLIDLRVTGSEANYNYNKDSDIDLHLIFDFDQIPVDKEILKDYFIAKKDIFNSKYNFLIKNIPIEVGVEDNNSPLVSTGVYSLISDSWLREPDNAGLEVMSFSMDNYNKIKQSIENVLQSNDLDKIHKLKKNIKKLRVLSLATQGEFGEGNLIFKQLRSDGYLQRIKDAYNNLTSKSLSLEETENSFDFNPLIELLGTTDNIKEAGFILPDGSLLDLSGKSSGGDENKRNLNHADMKHFGYSMSELLDNGAIRLGLNTKNQPFVQISVLKVKPTAQQWEKIDEILCTAPNTIDFEITPSGADKDNPKTNFYKRYTIEDDIRNIKNDMNSFINGDKTHIGLYSEDTGQSPIEEDIVDNTPTKYFDKLKALFGTTYNYLKAGFILPDGSLLDLSDKTNGGATSVRNLNTTDLKQFGYSLVDLLDKGIIRLGYDGYHNTYIQISLKNWPTEKQWHIVERAMGIGPSKLDVEATLSAHEGKPQYNFYKNYNWHDNGVEDIKSDLRDYMSGKSTDNIYNSNNAPIPDHELLQDVENDYKKGLTGLWTVNK